MACIEEIPRFETDPTQLLRASQVGRFPEYLGLEWMEARKGFIAGRFAIQPHHLSPGNGFLHAASLVGLLDSACGFGCMMSFPEGASNFTTIELKTNFLGTLREGAVACEARLSHGGRTTQVWDAEAKAEGTGKVLALFRCTQLLLYPRN